MVLSKPLRSGLSMVVYITLALINERSQQKTLSCWVLSSLKWAEYVSCRGIMSPAVALFWRLLATT